MDYSNYAQLIHKKIIVGDQFVEYEGCIWQVRNLSKVSIQKTVIPFKLPKPCFNQPRPKQKANLISAITIMFLGFLISATFLLYWIHLPAIGIALGIIVYSLNKSKRELEQWQKKKDLHERRLNVWNKINTNPQIIYTLSIVPNTTPDPLLYSYDRKSVNSTVNAIKEEMSQPSLQKTIFKINVIDVPKDKTVYEVGSHVYEKAVKALD
jgi:hypothetical protein